MLDLDVAAEAIVTATWRSSPDPDGNALMLHHRYAPREERGLIVERTDFVSVPVTDLERSTAWYRDTLGLPQIGEGAWPEFQLGENVSLYLIDPTNIGREFSGPNHGSIALRVPDVEEARARARGPRHRVRRRDRSTPGVCHMAFFKDPDGNALMLHRRYAPRDQG